MNGRTKRLAEKIKLGTSLVIALTGLVILNWLLDPGEAVDPELIH
jgi:hypothetical protein